MDCMHNTFSVAGYACYFNVVDQSNDIILPTAFDITPISHQPNPFAEVKFLYQHDVNRPIGCWTLIRPDSVGLYVEGQLSLDLIDGKSASIMTQNQIIDGLSIGYSPVLSYRNAEGQRVLEQVILHEISLVTFPMQKHAKLVCV